MPYFACCWRDYLFVVTLFFCTFIKKNNMARELEFVLPSGVPMRVRALRGKEQETITTQGVDMNDALNQMLSDCTVSLGDNNSVTKNDIERMLSNDRVQALVELRQFSLRYKDVFEFTFEWPVRENGVKQTTEHEIQFNKDSFPVVPYIWVSDKIKSLSKDEVESLGGKFPIMYESYDAMLSDNLVHSFVDEDGQKVEWSVLTGDVEKRFSNTPKKAQNANLPLRMRNPKIALKGRGGESVAINWDPSNADILDTEKFRKQIKDVEGSIDTMLTIENPETKEQVRVNLIATVDFFFPSQAI